MVDTSKIAVGERIQYAMELRDIKSAELVRRCPETNKTSVSQWLKGISKPSADALISISKALNASPVWILEGGEFTEFNPALGLTDDERRLISTFRNLKSGRQQFISRVINDLSMVE